MEPDRSGGEPTSHRRSVGAVALSALVASILLTSLIVLTPSTGVRGGTITLPPLPYAVNGAGVAQVGPNLVVAGGNADPYGNGPSNVGTIVVYNVTRNAWNVSSKLLPTPRRGVMAVAYGPEVFLIGGYDGSDVTDILAYNASTDQLRYVGALPYGVSFGAIASDGATAYVIGGIVNPYSYTNAIIRLNLLSGASSIMSVALPLPLVQASAAFVGGSVYVFGGWSLECGSSGCVQTAESAVLAFNDSSLGAAPVVAALPGPRAAAAVVT